LAVQIGEVLGFGPTRLVGNRDRLVQSRLRRRVGRRSGVCVTQAAAHDGHEKILVLGPVGVADALQECLARDGQLVDQGFDLLGSALLKLLFVFERGSVQVQRAQALLVQSRGVEAQADEKEAALVPGFHRGVVERGLPPCVHGVEVGGVIVQEGEKVDIQIWVFAAGAKDSSFVLAAPAK